MGEPRTLWDRVVKKSASALASGALQPIETRSVTLVDGGVRFLTRVAANLVRKQVVANERGPGFNPFLSPEEDLLIADISETHYALLNKFNVIENHVLIVTRAFEEQESLLSQADFEALWIGLRAIDGFAFYNAGREAGASQRHKHLQLVRAPLGEGPEHFPMDAALEREPGALPFRNASCSLQDCVDRTLEGAAAATRKRYLQLLADVGRENDPRAYNLLATRERMVVIPRSREAWASISVNALGFAGAFFVHDEDELEKLRRLGPMRLLGEVGLRMS